jgi:WXG100 family type VII secretion target
MPIGINGADSSNDPMIYFRNKDTIGGFRMAGEGINISLGQVQKTSATIRTINKSLNARLEDIKKEMNNLSSTWKSDSSETIRQKFNALAPKFEQYKDVIESYSKFLDATVEGYNAAETVINNNASAFK